MVMQVTVRNSQWERRAAYFFEVAEFNHYEGEEIKVKWVKDHELALTTGEKDLPFRVIQRSLIVNIDNVAVTQQPSAVQTKVVKGSKGEHYVVTLGPTPSCTCSGFTFRKTCKHVTNN